MTKAERKALRAKRKAERQARRRANQAERQARRQARQQARNLNKFDEKEKIVRKPKKLGGEITSWLENFGKDLLGSSMETLGENIAQIKPVQDETEKGIGQLLGKYKGWIIGGAILVIGSIVASVLTLTKKKK